ncbi:hypothetical protein FE257_000022 [Aspergillus nanangensis]|uniref:LipA and NB-ARC domain protein n=1 Tax=Aspergillus nanangensis TaxID=2582783 RepID=A0AAD4GZU5_ASPNN|nr:hypothetical protein FE257_000022 [Aspergillus nanangensis]
MSRQIDIIDSVIGQWQLSVWLTKPDLSTPNRALISSRTASTSFNSFNQCRKQHDAMASDFQIRRKPVPSPVYTDAPTLRGVTHARSVAPSPQYLSPRPILRTTPSAETLPPYSSIPHSPYPPVQRAATDIRPASSSGVPPPAAGPSTVQRAYGEARHFLGGLIAHPTESNRHYTILRHSHGVVFYRGSTTSVTVSVFSDTPLPPDRTLWLQSKGWTGKTGMRAKALLHLTDDWLDVTPSLALRAAQVNPPDERAWQRDIAKFQKKASGRLRDHRLRETIVARIPVEAGDGYFQLILCQGAKKKKLCASPVFRVLSTSISPSSLRGASLSTLPLEAGAMVLSMYAQSAARTVLAPVTQVVQAKVDVIKPGLVQQTAAGTAFSMSGLANRIGGGEQENANNPNNPSRQIPNPPDLDQGPQPPFPMDFKARTDLASPRTTLSRVPDTIPDQLHGFFFGWARFDLSKSPSRAAQDTPNSQSKSKSQSPSPSPWTPAIISVRNIDPSQQARINISQSVRKVTALRFLDDTALPPQTKVHVRVMGFLRPDVPAASGRTEKELMAARETAAEAAMLADSMDFTCTQGILEHGAWAPERGVDAQERGWVDRTKEGVGNARARGQKMVENVPLHWLGVRSGAAEVRDRGVGVNGFYIVR